MSARQPPIVEARAVGRIFSMPAGPVAAVRDVTLEIGEAEYVAIAGPSGCGKSTLLHVLGCVDTATSGEVRLEGRDVGSLTDRQRSAIRLTKIGFVFQRFFLLPMLSALENVELPQAEAGTPRAERRERARMLLDYVGLAHRADHRPPSSRAARCSAWPSRARWPTARAGPGRRAHGRAGPGHWRGRSPSSSIACTPTALPSSSSPTTRRLPTEPNACCTCATAGSTTGGASDRPPGHAIAPVAPGAHGGARRRVRPRHRRDGQPARRGRRRVRAVAVARARRAAATWCLPAAPAA